MKRFMDLHLCPNLQDLEQLEKMINKSFELGYSMVGIPFPTDIRKDTLLQLRKICSDANVDLVTRTDLVPKTPDELLNRLRRYRQKFELISVMCFSKPVARQAAKDRRVDILSFPMFNRKWLFFDRAEAELASKTGVFLEISMSSLLESQGFQRVYLISALRKMVTTARKSKVPILISSGAPNTYLMRPPRDFAALTFLFGMDSSDALRSFSEYPWIMVNRNREKLASDYVINGVRVVRRRKKS